MQAVFGKLRNSSRPAPSAPVPQVVAVPAMPVSAAPTGPPERPAWMGPPLIDGRIEAERVALAAATMAAAVLRIPEETKDCFVLLGLDRDATDMAELKTRYRALAKAHHPDHGGCQNDFVALNRAYAEALKTLRSRSV